MKRKIRARAVLFGMRLTPIDEFVAAQVIGYIVMSPLKYDMYDSSLIWTVMPRPGIAAWYAFALLACLCPAP